MLAVVVMRVLAELARFDERKIKNSLTTVSWTAATRDLALESTHFLIPN